MSNYEISKSSLLSLKAEIIRKQEDLCKAKLENVKKIKAIKKKTPLELKNKGVEERRCNDLDEEDQDLLKLSKSKLEAKARLYERLSGLPNQNDEINKRYLVRFDQKDKICDHPPIDADTVPDLPVESDEEERHFSDEYDEAVDPAEEWVEYTDCLGRSRKCLRKDLEYLKSKDAHLISEKSTTIFLEKSTKNDDIDNEEIIEKATSQDEQSHISNEESELLSGDMRREMLRQQWEQEEAELTDKTDIHYQNVLFNEARQHGVGYYAFSKDEEERAKQQEALKKIREETEKQQKKAQDLKALREKQMAARMKAAHNRKRARLGLPPEEDDPTPPPESTKPETEEDKKKEEQKIAEAEALLNEARKRHVRPWDIGKEGVSEHYEMTQEEWNEKQRQERTEEFAPPKSYSTREFTGMQFLERDVEENDKSLKFSTKKLNILGWKNLQSVNSYNKMKDQNKRLLEDKNSMFTTKSDNNSEKAPTEYDVNKSDDASSDCILKDYKKSQDISVSSLAALRGLNPYKNNYYEPTEPTSDIEENDYLLSDYKISKANRTTGKPTPIINEVEEVDFDDRLLADYNRVTKTTHLQTTPIINEVEEVDFDDRLLADYNRVTKTTHLPTEEHFDEEYSARKRGVEIAPPPTFDYYGPGESKRVKTSSGQVNIADSIEAGLKFLRKQAGRKGKHCVDDNM